MPFFGFGSQSKRPSDWDQKYGTDPTTNVTAHSDELYAQIEILQAEMSQLYMQMAFMKTDNDDSIDRHGKQEDMSCQSFSTREATPPPSTPRSIVHKRTSSPGVTPPTNRRLQRRDPRAPVSEIVIPVLASNAMERSRRSHGVSDDPTEKVLPYRGVWPSCDHERESAQRQTMKEQNPPLPMKRQSGKSSGSNTASSKSGGSHQSSALVRYRTVKRVVKQTEIIPQPKPLSIAELCRLEAKPTVCSLSIDVAEVVPTTAEHANIDAPTPSTSKRNKISIEWPPPSRNAKKSPPPVSNMIRKMARATELSNNFRAPADKPQLLLAKGREKDLGLKQTTQRIGIARKKRHCIDGMEAIFAEILNGVTLKPVDRRAHPASKRKINPLLLTVQDYKKEWRRLQGGK